MEKETIERSIKKLSEQVGCKIKYKAGSAADFELEITTPNDKTIKYLADVKLNFSNARLGDHLLRAARRKTPFLLITNYVTQPQAEKMREFGAAFLDEAGNAFLNAPEFFVFITGKKGKESKEKPINIFRPAGMKLLLAFLQKPGFENADYRSIAAETGLTHTTVGRVLSDLEKGGFLLRRSNENRFLTNKSELIKRWSVYYSEQYRVQLKPIRYHSTKHSGRWWEDIEIADYNAVWGGETGGAILTKHLRPETATIYANSRLPKLQARHGLVRDEKGEIEILQKFWKFGEVGNVAPPLVIYADLLATADERNLETAQMIYDEYLAQIAEESAR